MADITISTQSLPASWTVIAHSDRLTLASCNPYNSWPVLTAHHHDTWIVMLSRTDNVNDVLHKYQQSPDTFIDTLGVSAGIIWQPETGNICVFRDKFGFIPLMLIHHSDGGMTITTSPDLHSQFTQSRAINHAYFGRFLRMIDSDSTDDVFENTERILPGEIRHFDILTPQSASNRQIPPSSCYWHRRHYTPFSSSRHVLAEQLRHVLIESADRIPSDNPVFTLSGGLDSSGILAAYCHSRQPLLVDAVSLVSTSHASCDESKELDILEHAFPLRLRRIDMDKSWPLSNPELYQKYRAYGPHVAPGIESTLAIYRKIEAQFGPRTVITGYGGNFIVKVRTEALWRHLLSQAMFSRTTRKDIFDEIAAMRPRDIRTLAARVLGNIADGRIRAYFKRHLSSGSREPHILNECFAAQFPAEHTDPIFFMSHCEERTWLPVSWEWEMCARALDMIARETSHAYYDPLFDAKVYDFCAQIPPQYFLKCRDYRTIYKDALAALLPAEIIHHPKIQSFDDLMLDGLKTHAKAYIQHKIDSAPDCVQNLINTNALSAEFHHFCQTSHNRSSMPYPISHIWRALSVCVWTP